MLLFFFFFSVASNCVITHCQCLLNKEKKKEKEKSEKKSPCLLKNQGLIGAQLFDVV